MGMSFLALEMGDCSVTLSHRSLSPPSLSPTLCPRFPSNICFCFKFEKVQKYLGRLWIVFRVGLRTLHAGFLVFFRSCKITQSITHRNGRYTLLVTLKNVIQKRVCRFFASFFRKGVRAAAPVIELKSIYSSVKSLSDEERLQLATS